MKKLIAVATVMAVATANAEELKFGDVNYFLKQSEQNIIVDANQTFESSKAEATDNKSATRSTLLSASYAYAFSNQLNGSLAVDYAHYNKTEDKTGNQNSFTSNGFSNPAFGLNYRLMNQTEARYNLDFGAILKVNVQDSETGNIGPNAKDGNFADGQSSLELNARMGRKWNEANEWQLAAGLIYNNDGETTLEQTDEDVELDSSYDLFLRATYQYRPVNEFMMLLSLQATQFGDADADVDGAGGKIKTDSYTDYDVTFVAKYLMLQNVIAKFNYGISYTPDIDAKTDGANSGFERRHQNFFGLGVDYLF